MYRRSPRPARFLGLWTAGWLFVLLLAGVLWVGDLSVQWPVLLIPLVWAAIALRPRRSRDRPLREEEPPDPLGPGTREQPWLPEVPPDAGPPREG
jgi:hypothetical protein